MLTFSKTHQKGWAWAETKDRTLRVYEGRKDAVKEVNKRYKKGYEEKKWMEGWREGKGKRKGINERREKEGIMKRKNKTGNMEKEKEDKNERDMEKETE